MKLGIRPAAVTLTLLCCVAFLLLANCLGIVSAYYFERPTLLGLVPLFSFDRENNIPTFYSTLAIVLAALLLLMIAKSHRQENRPSKGWFFLSLVFLFLAIDEAASLHEQVGPVFMALLGIFDVSSGEEGLIHYAWVIPYGIFAAVVLFVCARPLQALPRRVAGLMLVAGLVYLLGAVGLEILGGIERGPEDSRTLYYAVLYTFEELFEMLGVLMFIHALLGYLAESTGSVVVEIKG